jgi:hypothetical protein
MTIGSGKGLHENLIRPGFTGALRGSLIPVTPMQQKRSATPAHERDPVAVFVEKELRELARTSDVKTNLNPAKDRNVELRFDDVVVHGETRDIALLRLASALLEVERFKLPLTRALGPELHEEAEAHAVDGNGSTTSASNE